MPVNSTEKRPDFALAKRGGCEFSTKAINAQASGFQGLVIFDTENGTKFSQLVSSPENSIGASFLRIPVVFLRLTEAEIVEKELQNYLQLDFFIQDDSSKNFVPIPLTKKSTLGDKIAEKIEVFYNNWSPLSLILMGSAVVLALIFLVAFQVCLCHLCYKKRQRNRVFSETCNSLEIPNMTSQLPDSVITYSTYEQTLGPTQSETQFEVSCPVCLEIPLPPRKIFQCSQGHGICDRCLTQIADQKCPTCREDWANMSHLPARNRMAEAMIHNYFNADQENHYDKFAPSAPPPPEL